MTLGKYIEDMIYIIKYNLRLVCANAIYVLGLQMLAIIVALLACNLSTLVSNLNTIDGASSMPFGNSNIGSTDDPCVPIRVSDLHQSFI